MCPNVGWLVHSMALFNEDVKAFTAILVTSTLEQWKPTINLPHMNLFIFKPQQVSIFIHLK